MVPWHCGSGVRAVSDAVFVYVVNSLLWAAAGLGLGFVLGRQWRAIHDIRRQFVADPVAMAPKPPPRHRRPKAEQVLGGILVILALLSVTGVAIQTERLNQLISCQAEYNRAFAESIRIRADATIDERNRTKNLWLAFLAHAPAKPGEQTPEGREASIRALNDYLAALDRANAARQIAPIPTNQCTQTGPLS